LAGARGEDAAPAAADYLVSKWDLDDGLPDDTVNALCQTQDGYLWIGTNRGLARFDGLHFQTGDSAIAQSKVRYLCESRDGALWIGGDKSALVRKFREEIAL